MKGQTYSKYCAGLVPEEKEKEAVVDTLKIFEGI